MKILSYCKSSVIAASMFCSVLAPFASAGFINTGEHIHFTDVHKNVKTVTIHNSNSAFLSTNTYVYANSGKNKSKGNIGGEANIGTGAVTVNVNVNNCLNFNQVVVGGLPVATQDPCTGPRVE